MKVSKLIVPMVFLTATINNNNQVVASCESLCNDGFHAGIDKCTANSLPWMVLGCYAGCGVFYATCMGVCAAIK